MLSLTVPSIVILSLQKDSIQKRHGLRKNMRGNKKGQVPGTSKRKKKSEMRGKNRQVSGVELGVQRCPLEQKKGQVSDSRIMGIYYPPEKKEKEKRKEKDSPCYPKAKIKEDEI